jgi:carbon monoxide dehydrogenase subunit G
VEIKNSFEVPVGIDLAWEVLTDVQRVAGCMPGAELTEVADDGSYRGKVKVKVGPIAMSFAGEARFVELDEASKRMLLKAKGKELRGRGAAEATVTSQLAADGDSTVVDITTDIQLSGTVAQFGRGMIGDVSSHLVGQFADCLATQLAGTREEAAAATAKADEGVPAIRLFMRALWNAIRRLFRPRARVESQTNGPRGDDGG